MLHTKRLFFIPVGLPGMGKSTLAKKLRSLKHVTLTRISYDSILEDKAVEYARKHPGVPFHESIDIIRSKTDKEYLD